MKADDADASPFAMYDDMYRIERLGTAVYGNIQVNIMMTVQMEKTGTMSRSPGYCCFVSYACNYRVSR